MGNKLLATIALLFFFFTTSPVLAEMKTTRTTEEEIQAFEVMFGKGPQEEDVYRTDRLLLTATGSLRPVHTAPSVASVITDEDIKKIGATDLNEVLEAVPGLHIAPSTKNANDPIISIRGIRTSLNPQVLILINGIPISAAWTASRPFLRMPVANILRVEVVRGPGSAIHGADAFSGVINIITKDGQAINGSHIGARAGSFDSYGTWLQHGKKYNDWDVAVNLEYQKSNGDKDKIIRSDLQKSLDAAIGTDASLTPAPLNTEYEIINANLSLAKENWQLRLWGMMQDNGPADGVTQTLSNKGDAEIEQFLADLTYNTEEIIEDLDVTARFNYHYYKQDSFLQLFPPGSTLFLGGDGNINFTDPVSLVVFPDGVYGEPIQIDHQTGLELVALYKGISRQQWRFSIGYKYIDEDYEEYKNFGPGITENLNPLPAVNSVSGELTDVTGTDYIYANNQTRRLGYVSTQDEWSITPNWEVTAGVRYDHYSDFGDTVNPRIALVWETRYDLTTKFMYGRAFRPPSFSELYARNNPSNTGNPDLEPETIETWEIAFDYQPAGNLHTILNFFHYEINDLIELVQVDPGQAQQVTQNNKDQKGQGFEIEFQWDPADNLEVRSNLAYQRSKDKETEEIVPYAPEMQFYLNTHWRFSPEWSMDMQYFWIGKRHRASNDPRSDIDDYDLVNLIIRKKNIGKNVDAALAVRNLFDEDVREPSLPVISNDYPVRGRSMYGELTFHF